MTSILEGGHVMGFGSKVLVGTIAGFLAVAYSWIFRAKKVHSERDAGAKRG
jgi:hypothetical protein